MHASRPRHVVRLRITLMGIEPAIWRDVVIDRSARLSELHEAIQIVFGADRADHHVFVDRCDAFVAQDAPWGGLPPSARRWGDRWTMIDLRDPTVHDESSVTVAQATLASNPLYYSWRAADPWWCRIDALEDDVLNADSPRLRLTDGANRSPLRECPDAATYDTWLRVLERPDHPDHADVRAALDRSVGPWACFDPAEFLVDEARSELDDAVARPHARRDSGFGAWRHSPLHALMDEFPSSHRRGLEAHVRRSGLLMPPVITNDDAATITEPFLWFITAAVRDGLPLVDGALAPATAERAAEALGRAVEDMGEIVAAARQLGLLYARTGLLRAPRRATDLMVHPTSLWRLMAAELLGRRLAGTDESVNALFVLGIADGTLASGDPDAGLSRIAAAMDVLRGVRRQRYAGAWREVGDYAYAGYGRHYDDHGGRCDFSDDPSHPSPYEGWLADRRSALDTSEPSGLIPHEIGLPKLLAPMVRTLAPLGLRRDVAGTWVVPDSLREFARAALT